VTPADLPAAERCPTCDKPRGDDERARSHPAMIRWGAFVNAKRTERAATEDVP